MSFLNLHEYLSKCWDCEEEGMSQKESCSYIGVISYLSYEVRHTFMGDRLVKLDGKRVKKWDDEMFRLFDKEQPRFEVGMELSWPHMLFIMAAWWECYRNNSCPVVLLPLMREFAENIETLLLKVGKKEYADVKPFVHGAIYGANPYLMLYMEKVNMAFLMSVYTGKQAMPYLARVMDCSIYHSYQYDAFLIDLMKQAEKYACGIEELQFEADEAIYEKVL